MKLTSFISEFRLLSVAALFSGSYYFFKSLLYSLFCSLFQRGYSPFSFFFLFCCPKICHRDWGKQTSKYPGHFYFVEKRTKIYVCLSACVCVCVCGRYMGRGWIPSWNSSGQWPRHYVTSAIHGETPVSPIISLFIFVVVFSKLTFVIFWEEDLSNK